MPKFRAGDVCIGQNFAIDTEMNGVECEVREVAPDGVAAFHFRTHRVDIMEGPAYFVCWEGGDESWVREWNLRKRPPEQGWQSFEKATGIKIKGKVNA